jgi:hypothetical protein
MASELPEEKLHALINPRLAQSDLRWVDVFCRSNRASQELLVVQSQCEALKVGEEASGRLLYKVEANIVNIIRPLRSGLLQRSHDAVKELQEVNRLTGVQESLGAHGIRTEAGKLPLRAKEQGAVHTASTFAEMLCLPKLER